MKKFTKKEMFNEIKKVLMGGESEVTVDEMSEFCDKQIDLIMRKAEKAKEKANAGGAANDELAAAVEAVLTDELQTIADITMAVGGDATVSKVSYRLSALAKADRAISGDIKIPATETSRPRVIKGYMRLDY